MSLDTPTGEGALESIWRCPVCQEPLKFQDNQGYCDNNHRFDRARQGYYNLLLANQKRSNDPGDTREMMLRRRTFLNAGHYQPLADHLCLMLRDGQDRSDKPLTVLDSGCGEGYYLEQLSRSVKAMHGYGLDISREALKLAAREYPERQWVVASSFSLPVQSNSVDRVLRVFAPGDDAEVRRVLRDGGELWRVAPGPEHLQQLKARLYDKVQLHKEPNIPDGFVELARDRLNFTLELISTEQIEQLLGMTPFAWQSSPQKLEQLRQLERLEVEADFIVQRFGVDNDR